MTYSMRHAVNGVAHIVPTEVASADGAISLTSGGQVYITKGSAAALTLAVPTVQNGARLAIIATTAHAHTVTVSGGLRGAGTGADVGTFGGAIGDGVVLVSYNGTWHVEPGSNLNVTFA
jgi:hypothetical protein